MVVLRYSQLEEVVLSATLSGCNAPLEGLATLPAPTITTIPIRIVLQQSMTVRDILQKAEEQAVHVIPHEHVGL